MRPPKVAIVGGGCAALSAAFELTRPDREDGAKYEVTVYQLGWRLGGKGASGRNRDKWNRTEEHGLHVWLGFYENAFRLVRDAYAELALHYADRPDARQSRYGDWREAFFADPWIGLADESRGYWRAWTANFPANEGLPGDPLAPGTNPFSLSGYVTRSIDLLRALVRSTFSATPVEKRDAAERQLEFSEVSPRAVVDKITSLLRTGLLAGAGALYEAMAVLDVALSGTAALPENDFRVLKYAEAIAENVKRETANLLRVDDQIRPKLELIDLVMTIIVGIVRDELLTDPRGLDAINDEDCRAWLRRHGASERALRSPFVRGLYDMAFVDSRVFDAREEHAPASAADEPGLAAGQALRGALRMFFTYRGAMFWKMRAGMGDAVFSPLYEVLKLRGVRFEFFHRLTDVELGDEQGGARCVKLLHFDVQARVREGRSLAHGGELAARLAADEYYPLDADGCWPSKPAHAQLVGVSEREDDEYLELQLRDPKFREQPERNRRTLELGRDFDFVVLGLSVGAVRHACKTLVANDPRWSAMVDNVKTAPTQALQLWLNEGLENLTDTPTPITVTGLRGAFDTWSDMTHVIAEEDADPPPAGLAYLCGLLSEAPAKLPARFEPEDEPRPEQIAEWRRAACERAVHYLDHVLPALWPAARDEETRGFRWALLATPGRMNPAHGKTGRIPHADKLAILEQQFVAVNVKASDRYVLARPGSLEYRISPLDESYDNLTVAGDWTDCGFNEGCVEAAVMSGMLASHALSSLPALEDIVGYDHP